MSSKHFSPDDVFMLCYTAIIGVLAGIFGNIWATAFFEYVIRCNQNLATFFWLLTYFLVFVVALSTIGLVYGYREHEKGK